HGRPGRPRREVVEDDDAAGLQHLSDSVWSRALRLSHVEEQQREWAVLAQCPPVSGEDLDARAVGKHLRDRLGEALVDLCGADPGVVAGPAQQPCGADPTASPALAENASPARGEGGQQAAGLRPTRRDKATASAQIERAGDDLGQIYGS